MEVEKIYQKKEGNRYEVIYQLVSGLKVIKRSDNIVEKFNINKWEVISFIPDDFQYIECEITSEEEKELKQFIKQEIKKKNNNYWGEIKNKIIKYLRFRK